MTCESQLHKACCRCVHSHQGHRSVGAARARSRRHPLECPGRGRGTWPCAGPAYAGGPAGAFRADPDVLRFAARVSVWMRWLVGLVVVVELAYRPGLWFATDREYLVLLVALVACNGLAHARLSRRGTVTWRWLLGLSAVDVALITAAVFIGGEFHLFVYVAYFPFLGLFAAVFASLGLCLLWTTGVAALYAGVSVVSSGLDYEAGQEKALLARIAAMYGVVLCVSLITRFERTRLREAAARERELQQDRIALSQAIHDTAAQTASMVAMGIHRARRLAGDSNAELSSTLAATATLSKTAAWELRRPIDEGRLFEGRELGRVLGSHAATFEKVASVPTAVHLTGTEPPLAVVTRARLFAIAHNALTNAFLHARAGQVEVRLNFGADHIRLAVADDGVGLPADYAQRGRGFQGMSEDAKRIGGRLIVESSRSGSGTTVTCEAPYG